MIGSYSGQNTGAASMLRSSKGDITTNYDTNFGLNSATNINLNVKTDGDDCIQISAPSLGGQLH